MRMKMVLLRLGVIKTILVEANGGFSWRIWIIITSTSRFVYTTGVYLRHTSAPCAKEQTLE